VESKEVRSKPPIGIRSLFSNQISEKTSLDGRGSNLGGPQSTPPGYLFRYDPNYATHLLFATVSIVAASIEPMPPSSTLSHHFSPFAQVFCSPATPHST